MKRKLETIEVDCDQREGPVKNEEEEEKYSLEDEEHVSDFSESDSDVSVSVWTLDAKRTTKKRNELGSKLLLSVCNMQNNLDSYQLVKAGADTTITNLPKHIFQKIFVVYYNINSFAIGRSVVGSDRRIYIQPGQSIDEFIHKNLPSNTSISKGDWIQIINHKSITIVPQTIQFNSSGKELLTEHELSLSLNVQTKKAAASATRSKILQTAKEFNSTTGKWMLQPNIDIVNEIWKKICVKTNSGQLGSSAKVSTNDGSQKMFLICVYNDDFTNLEEIQRIHKVLKEMGCETKSYKPDCLTELGLNSGNPYGIDVVLYRIGTKNDTDFVKLKEIGGIIEEDRIKGEVFKKRKGEMKDGPKKKLTKVVENLNRFVGKSNTLVGSSQSDEPTANFAANRVLEGSKVKSKKKEIEIVIID